MNIKSKRILALTSAAAILATSLPINAFAGGGLEIGPEIGVHSNVKASLTLKPIIRYKWKKYDIKKDSVESKKQIIKESYRRLCSVYDSGLDVFSTFFQSVTFYPEGKLGYYYDTQKYLHFELKGAFRMMFEDIPYGTTLISNMGLVNYKSSRDVDTKPVPSNFLNQTVVPDAARMYNLEATNLEDYYFYIKRISKNEFEMWQYKSVPKTEIIESKGSYRGEVVSMEKGTYPSNSKSGNYWYEYVGPEVSKTIADQYNSPTKTITVDYNKTYDIKDGIIDKQPGATVTEVGGPVSTETSGDKITKAEIKFSDNSTKEVEITIHVNPSKAEDFNNKNKDNNKIHRGSDKPIVVVEGEKPDFTDIVKEIEENNPNVKHITTPEVDTNNHGTKTAKIKVEFNDGSKTEIDVTVNVINTDAAKFTPQLKPLIIEVDEELNEDKYKSAIKNYESGNIEKLDAEIDADSTKEIKSKATVKLTFKDKSTKKVEIDVVTIKVNKSESVVWGTKKENINLIDNVEGPESEYKVTDITNPEIVTTKSGNDQVGKIRVTVGESIRDFDINITVQPSESESKTNIKPKKIIVPWGDSLNIRDGIENLPDNVKNVEDISETPFNNKKNGNQTRKARITFSDGSTKKLDIPVIVLQSEAEKFTPIVQKVVFKIKVPIDYSDAKQFITNLPSNVKAVVEKEVDNKYPHESKIIYKVTFPDTSEKVIEIPAVVKEWDSKLYGDKIQILDEYVDYGKEIDLSDNLSVYSPNKYLPANVPEEILKNTTIEDVTDTKIDTTKPGTYKGFANIKFPDGSMLNKPYNVIVGDPMSDSYPKEGDIIKEEVDWGKKIDLTDNIQNLPEGSTVEDITDPAIDTNKSGNYTGKVKITFKDTSSKVVEVPVEVKKSESEKFIPKVLSEKVVKGNKIDLTDNIENLPSGATVKDISNPSIDTNKTGKQTAKAEITFADGSKKEIEVSVNVVVTAGTIIPVPGIAKENIVPEVVGWGKTINLMDNIKKLPEGATIADITDPEINTKKSGDYTGRVEVTFKDGSKRRVEIPIKVQKSEAETFVPNQKPITAKRTQLADISEPFSSKPNGARIEVKTPVDTETTGDKIGVVTVTFSDGSIKDYNIEVTVTSLESDTFNPVIKDEIVNWGTAYDLADNITNKPADAKIEDVTGSKINTQQSGEHTGKVKITFGDGSEKEYNVKVIVNKSESENYSKEFNNATDVTTERVIKGGTIDFTDNFKKPLPEGFTIKDITKPTIDINVDGKYTGKVQVTFKDGSTMEVSIPVEIYISGSIIKPIPRVNNSDIEDEVVNWSGVIDLEDNIKNLPKGSGVMDITSPVIDTTKPGKYTGKVEITFPDGSKRVVEVPIEIKKAQSETFTPEINEEKLPYGKEVTPSDIIKNIPSDATAEFIGDNKIDPTKSGKQNATIKITFVDGSTKEYPVEVEVEKSQSEKYKENPNIEPERIPRNNEINLTDNIKDLPEGSTVVDTTKDKIDTSKLGTSTGTVEVTFPDGTKAEFEVPVEVYKTEAEAFGKPITTKEVVNKGGEIDLTDNVVNLPEDAKVIDTTDPKIDTNELGDYTATAKIVFKDGSEIEIEIRVVVTDGKIDDTDHSGNDGNISGIITNDTNGSYKGPKDFRFNIKSDGDTPEYKTKSDGNSQENKHKALDNLLNGISNLGRRNNVKSNENNSMATKYVFKIGEKSYKTIHGNNVTSHKMDVAPYIKNDRTMMPLRYVAEAIGADVQWDNSTRTAYFEKDGLVAKIQVDGNKIVMSNGKVYEMDEKPDNINDRILVSITNVSKVFNLTNGHIKDGINQNIEWDQDTQTVTIRR